MKNWLVNIIFVDKWYHCPLFLICENPQKWSISQLNCKCEVIATRFLMPLNWWKRQMKECWRENKDFKYRRSLIKYGLKRFNWNWSRNKGYRFMNWYLEISSKANYYDILILRK